MDSSTIDLIRPSVPHMVQNSPLTENGERGVIIRVSSSAAFDGQPGQVAYAASKGAVASITPLITKAIHNITVDVSYTGPLTSLWVQLLGIYTKVLHHRLYLSMLFHCLQKAPCGGKNVLGTGRETRSNLFLFTLFPFSAGLVNLSYDICKNTFRLYTVITVFLPDLCRVEPLNNMN